MSVFSKDQSTQQISYCRIHPGIGIARLGNSLDGYFIGPEAPGIGPTAPGQSDVLFKDNNGRVKRQAARFRIYAYDDMNNVVQELTADDADIKWSVHLANKKAAWYKFRGRHREGPEILRNQDTADRNKLINDPGSRSITGINKNGQEYKFDNGSCFDEVVPLGEVRTDEQGRLLVLGGFGHSASPDNTDIITYANNDGWYDDTSDGPVKATVTLKSGRTLETKGNAWVIVAPPKFAPYHYPIITLYDAMQEVAFNEKWSEPPDDVSFTRDIFPILSRAVGYKWLNSAANRGHGSTATLAGKAGSFLDFMGDLSNNDEAHKDLRSQVFDRIRDPKLVSDPDSDEAHRQASPTFMPQLSGDGGDNTVGDITTWLTILPRQYENFRKWKDGDFKSDWPGSPASYPTLEEISVKDQPAALDRAPLEYSIGGAFFPGIEMTYIVFEPSLYDGEPFRLSSKLQAGDITKHMAVPWQADFYQCEQHWWPAARPDDVIPETEYLKFRKVWESDPYYKDNPVLVPSDAAAMVTHRESWARGIPDTDDDSVSALGGDMNMVIYWSQFGFVVPRQSPDPHTPLYVETERNRYAGLNTREFFYRMMNIESNQDFLPKARELVKYFLKLQWLKQKTDPTTFPTNYIYFRYSHETFLARMDNIYEGLVSAADSFDPAKSPFQTYDQMVERALQLAPFNQLDGLWLRHVAKGTPIDEVHSLLFDIWMDEQGDGNADQNHANLYTQLLHTLGIDLPAVDSYDYAYNEELLESVFTIPLFELVISQFSEEFFPEVLGMTLQLEWEVLGLKQPIALLRKFNIDPHFYVMHVGIDNAVNGHGAKAKQAVMAYLDQIKRNSGEEAMQKVWKRIWNGYITFGTLGTSGTDIVAKIRDELALQNRVLEMIDRKKQYASKNHGKRKLGNYYINDLFDQPVTLLEQLSKCGYLIPGDPDNSPFFKRLTFDGPMYKVFTQEEIKLWQDYVRSSHSIPNTADDSVKTGQMPPGEAMLLLIRKLKDDNELFDLVQKNDMAIQGVDRNTGDVVTKPISWWISQNFPGNLLQAIHDANQTNADLSAQVHLTVDPTTGKPGPPGDPDRSPFLTAWLEGTGLQVVLNQPATLKINEYKYMSTNYENWLAVVRHWITAGCPVPPSSIKGAHRATPSRDLSAPSVTRMKVKRLLLEQGQAGKIWGMGNVH